MFEIKGKVNTAICYAKVVEDEAIEQIRRMCDYELIPPCFRPAAWTIAPRYKSNTSPLEYSARQ